EAARLPGIAPTMPPGPPRQIWGGDENAGMSWACFAIRLFSNHESRITNPGSRGNAMALNLTQKQEVVAELAEVAGSAHSLVAAEYAGLTVAQLTDMRKK